MMKRQAWINAAVLVGAAAAAVAAKADPVAYTLRTVADGKLGNWTFYEALVTIQMIGDTSNVQQQTGPNSSFTYTNAKGIARITVDDGYRTTVATFAAGEVYVRYDTYTGIAGFGSSISPTYPIALGCANAVTVTSPPTPAPQCAQGDWTTSVLVNTPQQGMYNGTAEGLADYAAFPGDGTYLSDGAYFLPTNLSQTTLLTGRAQSCATSYSEDQFGDLTVCPSAAPRGLITDKGGFYLQDRYGINNGTYANTGALQVEVLPKVEDE